MGIYNGLIRKRNAKDNNYSQIGIQLTRKYDLIPNLVKLVKGYMKHERTTLEEVIQARNMAANANAAVSANPSDPAAMKQMVAAEGTLGGVMGRLFALSESYPDLKANQNMMQLTEELTSTENKVTFCAAGVQRLGDGLQQRAAGVPGQHGRRHVRFHGGDLLRGRGLGGCRQGRRHRRSKEGPRHLVRRHVIPAARDQGIAQHGLL